ncbi:hypothetical protein [Qipengyuania sp. JC766]|uniref:hypothetical protein n=1 Tax=Qipengyuania sp. JC766 TaxID=3232139 RepID=UPI00345803D0
MTARELLKVSAASKSSAIGPPFVTHGLHVTFGLLEVKITIPLRPAKAMPYRGLWKRSVFGSVALGLWLVVTGGFMAGCPHAALRTLRQTAATRRINNVEQGLRLLAGVALVLRATASKMPAIFEIAGWFIVLSSIVLLVIPLRWHSAYAIWWADRLPIVAVRAISPLSVMAGIGVIYAAI